MSATIGDNGRRGLGPARRKSVDALGYCVGAALAAAAAIRRGKAVHPHGVVFEAELVVTSAQDAEGAELLDRVGSSPALVRFSRSLGLPSSLPDLLGMSLRIPDAYGPGRHQDLLLVSSIDAPVLHHLFLPADDVQRRPYSSSLPYSVAGRSLLLGALPRPESPRPAGADEIERAKAAAATGRLVFDLAVARMWGRFRPVAELRIGNELPGEADALSFNPWNSGGGLAPTGLLNRLRDYAYPLAQRARLRVSGEREHTLTGAGGTVKAPPTQTADHYTEPIMEDR